MPPVRPEVRFSVCIPTADDAGLVADTMRSVLEQEGPSLEVIVSDDASTDGTAEAAMGVGDPRVVVRTNRAGVGFAANLDRAVAPSVGEVVVIVAPGDVMAPGALAAYDAIFETVGPDTVIGARVRPGEPQTREIAALGPDALVWSRAPVNRVLSEMVERRVLELDAAELLERAIASMRNPFDLRATAYPRRLYDRVGGYLGARTCTPDKWFHWRLLEHVDRAVFVDDGLFLHRPGVVLGGAAVIEGALEDLVDDYVSSFELPAGIVARGGVDRAGAAAAFVEHDIARHGLAVLANGNRHEARRVARFGLAAYPTLARRNPRWWLLRALSAIGVPGESVARSVFRRSAAADGRAILPR